ncbi:MAG: hypothetical protein CK431_05105 [Mycobacterium sp.]|nr:MAG: hypothetical protein CK431_05105 [Mycobacterium sp.]
MWTYVLALGVGLLVDPMRIGMAAILMSRRQAIRSLLAFWLGGMIAGVSVGFLVLVLLHEIALGAFQLAADTINDFRSEVIFLSGRHLQLTLGIIALVCLATMVIRARARAQLAAPVPVSVGGGAVPMDAIVPAPGPTGLLSRLSARTQSMLECGFVWPAFLVGLGSSVPPIEGPMVLTVIMASRSHPGMQLGAFLVFILLALVFIEIPLVGYLVAPQQTQTMMMRMNTWIQSHRRHIVQTLLGLSGVVMLIQGIGSLV